MSDSHLKLLKGNEEFVAEKLNQDPDFFKKLSEGQSPDYLWIGCSDSRVPATEITNTKPGDIFVHRNIANVVVNTDMNLLSVLNYSVNYLKVKHVIVCGHYGCGGVLAAMSNKKLGLIDNWLSNIKDVYLANEAELSSIQDENERGRRLVELNVKQQVINLSKTSIIQGAWAEGNLPILHGWVYGLEDGKLKDLDIKINKPSSIPNIYQFENA
ncbi:carbonic anhydrase [Cytophagaceae bacterium ABcell3]|nr:carbonic anhydrase [Cytophagaceae bacterium ABcell3]